MSLKDSGTGRAVHVYAYLPWSFVSLKGTDSTYQWMDLDETWVVASHHVPDMSAMMRLPWQRPLRSNGAMNIQQLWAYEGPTREPIVMKFCTQQQIKTSMTFA